MGEIKFDGHGAGVQNARFVGKQGRLIDGRYTFSEDYIKGGEPFSLSEYFPKLVDGVIFEPKKNRTFIDEHDREAVRAIINSSGAEVAADQDLSDIGNVAEVQRLSLGGADGGTFKLKNGDNEETGALNHNVSKSSLETAINGLSGTANAEVIIAPGENDAEGEYVIVYDVAQGASGMVISDDSLTLTGEDEPDPSLEITTTFKEQGVKFWAWGY